MARTVPGLKKRKAPRSAFKKGQPRPANAGRKKGTPNKFTRDIKEALLHAFNAAGGQSWFLNLARKDKRSFAALVGKLLPTQVTGAGGGPLVVENIQKAQAGLAKLSDPELKSLFALMEKAGILELVK